MYAISYPEPANFLQRMLDETEGAQVVRNRTNGKDSRVRLRTSSRTIGQRRFKT